MGKSSFLNRNRYNNNNKQMSETTHTKEHNTNLSLNDMETFWGVNCGNCKSNAGKGQKWYTSWEMKDSDYSDCFHTVRFVLCGRF